jgi:hypothetical protein
VLDGYSRSIAHWDLRESMREADIEIILRRAKEKYPEARPRVISDNGLQFIARDFKEFIRISGMTHVRTSPSYPQSIMARFELVVAPEAGDDAATEGLAFAGESSPSVQSLNDLFIRVVVHQPVDVRDHRCRCCSYRSCASVKARSFWFQSASSESATRRFAGSTWR